MDRAVQLTLMRRLVARIADPRTELRSQQVHLSVDRYVDGDLFRREQQQVFRRHPVIVAHSGELAADGDYLRADLAGVPLVVLRDGGVTRAFVNACRHRGARLVDADRGCGKKALSCPYHNWTYALDGALIHVPARDSFGALDLADHGLVSVACAERHGFVWVQLDGTLDLAGFLGAALDDDLDRFHFDTHVALHTRTHETPANWKLVMDAFAEGYHLKTLHRTSLARFFLDTSVLDALGPHVRQLGARKSLLTARKAPEAEWDLRAETTLFYNLFPNTILVFHPLFISAMTLQPLAVDRVRVVHRMLVPPGEIAAAEQARLERSFEHIDGQVFQREDLAIAASIQSTLASGANETVVVGGMEEGMRLFHSAWSGAMDG